MPGSVGMLWQLVAAGATGWAAGELLLAWSRRRSAQADEGPLDWPERALLAVVGFVGFAVALMIAHIVTGGAVYGVPGVAPVAAAAVIVLGWRRRSAWGAVPWGRIAVFLLVVGMLYVAPLIVGGSGLRGGDPPWHLGWTEQVLAGEPVPTGPAPDLARNAYPWGTHAVLATMVRLAPGTDPLLAYESLHLLIVLSLPLAAACLARRLDPRAGWFAAGAASFVGGFGWLAARAPAFEVSPSEARFGADLVAASPNSVYEMLPPAFPRELGLVLLAAAGVLLLRARSAEGSRPSLLAGVVVGLVGVTSVPMFVSALVWVLVAAALSERGSRVRFLGRVLGGAGVIFAIWLGPVLSNYVRFGGFVNITPRLGMEWPVAVALASWGLLLPAAVAGVVWLTRSRPQIRDARIVLGFAGAAALMLALAKVRSALDWDLAGNATLLHQGRVWPVAHLLGAALAGFALVRCYSWLQARARKLTAAAAASVFFLVGSASPVLASIRFAEILEQNEADFDYDQPDLSEDSFLRRAARLLDADDTVAVEGSDRLAWLLWQLSGARLAAYDDPRLDHNDLRIRYADLAARWDARIDSEGFPPNYAVLPAGAGNPSLPRSGAVELLRGDFGGETWTLWQLP